MCGGLPELVSGSERQHVVYFVANQSKKALPIPGKTF
jgi:hypothetical protein